ncbi:uncharacterized protein (DUF885 family) [Actinophytocola algeriensis]|uniref:Uncharacterized protein (DUF885 family) n=2 Tax=Actinophytocola algeriensis TaxID=1768010 RepID=A0A7W7Q544_9PSEU|nr:uncharacterized protein (DUF885 family) [Actinophytocola algeriensis]MBE1478540.1 uncharacterized protein (DUF885 family) [Actinophytocola algeriensis]
MTNTVPQLADELLQLVFRADPMYASILGVPGHGRELADRSAAAQDDLRVRIEDVAARTTAVDPAGLSVDDAVTRAMVIHHAGQMIDEIDSRQIEFTISDLFIAPAAELIMTLPMVPLNDDEARDDYLARLRAVPAYLESVAARHREGVAAGRVPVERLVRNAIAHLDRYLAAPETDPLARQEVPEAFAAAREEVLATVVRPAFAAYKQALADEFLQHGRPDDKVGVCHLPGGDELYRTLARVHTTTDRTPDDLHQTGLDIIERLTEEYAEVGERVFGTRDRTEIFARMTTDPAMRWRDADELLASAQEAVSRAEAAVPGWFGRLASQQCKIEAVPAADAPGAPAAFYLWPSMDGQRPGIYFANTHKAEERDRFVSEVMAFHEAVPGHHFQIQLAQELTHLPMFRRVVNPNAYAEGWGLYTERLAEEMGLYSSDTYRLGMLAMDSMRAGRLVVDTGMHALGWSRQQAVDFLRENTPMSGLDIANEIDRYIAYPGQALSYMVGRLEIQRLRGVAEEALGDRFDIRAFHDVVLGNGSLPLAVLADVVTAWAV